MKTNEKSTPITIKHVNPQRKDDDSTERNLHKVIRHKSERHKHNIN